MADSTTTVTEDEAYHAETAVIGMWLFLATEVLFFGALIFTYLAYQRLYPAAMAEAVRHTEVPIGTANTVLLVTSSFFVSAGAGYAHFGNQRRLVQAFAVTFLLGAAFLALKGIEYADDFREHLFPGPGFGPTGAEAAHEQIFFAIYFVATGVHALHMLVGLGLIALVIRRAIRGDFSPDYTTPVGVTALYWSFVDIVWICLFPLLYLVGRGPS